MTLLSTISQPLPNSPLTKHSHVNRAHKRAISPVCRRTTYEHQFPISITQFPPPPSVLLRRPPRCARAHEKFGGTLTNIRIYPSSWPWCLGGLVLKIWGTSAKVRQRPPKGCARAHQLW